VISIDYGQRKRNRGLGAFGPLDRKCGARGKVEPIVGGGYRVLPVWNERDPEEPPRQNDKMAFDRRAATGLTDQKERQAQTNQPGQDGGHSVELRMEACHRSGLLCRGCESGSEGRLQGRLLVEQSKPKCDANIPGEYFRADGSLWPRLILTSKRGLPRPCKPQGPSEQAFEISHASLSFRTAHWPLAKAYQGAMRMSV
jgi:hypothetical protein